MIIRGWGPLCVGLAALLLPETTFAEPEFGIVAPPPVSGRSLDSPESITAADVLARVVLIRENLELLRRFFGRPAPSPSLFRVEGAHQREVFVQTYGLLGRSRQLAFEQLGAPMRALDPPPRKITAALNLERLNEVLVTVLRVRRSLGIKEGIAEEAQSPTTTPSDVFNAIVETAELLDIFLDKKTDDADVFTVTTLAFNLATKIAARRTRQFLVPEPPLEHNKTPSDVYRVLYRCFQEIRSLAEIHELDILRFEVSEARINSADSTNVMELLVVIVAELMHLHRELLNEDSNLMPYYGGRKFPSHALQRARHLEAVLKTLVAAGRRRGGR